MESDALLAHLATMLSAHMTRDAKQAVRPLADENAQLHQALAALHTQLAHQQHIMDLQAAQHKLEHERTMRTHDSLLSATSKAHASALQEARALQEAVDAHVACNVGLHQQLVDQQHTHDAAMAKQAQIMHAQANTHKEEWALLQADIESGVAKHAALETKCLELEHKLGECTRELAASQKQAKSGSTQWSAAIRQHEKEVTMHAGVSASALAKLMESEKKYYDLGCAHAELERKYAELKHVHTDSERKHTELEREHTDLGRMYVDVETKCKVVTHEYANCDRLYTALLKKYAHLQSRMCKGKKTSDKKVDPRFRTESSLICPGPYYVGKRVIGGSDSDSDSDSTLHFAGY